MDQHPPCVHRFLHFARILVVVVVVVNLGLNLWQRQQRSLWLFGMVRTRSRLLDPVVENLDWPLRGR